MFVRTAGDIGRLIRDARMRAGMSQKALASRFGTTQSWISEVENGKETAEIGMVLRVLAFLKLDLDMSAASDRRPGRQPEGQDDSFPDIDDIVGGGPRP